LSSENINSIFGLKPVDTFGKQNTQCTGIWTENRIQNVPYLDLIIAQMFDATFFGKMCKMLKTHEDSMFCAHCLKRLSMT